uniref:RNA-dependent RNA polymerase n=1 Tax=Mito-like bionusvirus TaxID=2784743 RepID=A0A7S6YL82_9VIRU|nr:RNA-dependent RNA polymerase [Mito-like bionusvirus]
MLGYSRRRSRYLCFCIDSYVSYFNFQCEVRGTRSAMKACKLAFTTGLHVALGRRVKTRKGTNYPLEFPKALSGLYSWLRGSPEKRKVALTFLSSYRLMECEAYYDFDSIFFPPESKILLGSLLSKEVKFLRNFSPRLRPKSLDPSSVSIMSSGPYGGECTTTSALSAASLLRCPEECVSVLALLKASGTPFRVGLRYLFNSACTDWPTSFASRLGKARHRKFRFPSSAVDAASYFRHNVGVQFSKESFGPSVDSGLGLSEKYSDDILYNSSSEPVPYFTFDSIDPQFHLYDSEDGSDLTEDEVFEIIDSFQRDLSSMGSGRPYLSRLTFVPKEGGGTRPVTPTNMFVQIALTPIHDLFMYLCSSQPGDCTFDESTVSDVLCRSTGLNEESFSFDWSSATDFVSVVDNLFPIVREVVGEKLALHWKRLVSIEIAMPYSGKSFDESVIFTSKMRLPLFRDPEAELYSEVLPRWNLFRYQKGAPMGLRSLWPVFAVFHHCFRALADRIASQFPGKFLEVPDDIFDTSVAKRILFSVDTKGMYRLKHSLKYGSSSQKDKAFCKRLPSLTKGDDQWLKGKLRSHIYLLLCELSGFKISINKSVVSERGLPSAAEFSKRYFVSGLEITPLSAKAVNEACRTKNPLLLSEVIRGALNVPDSREVKRKNTIAKAASLSFSKVLRTKYKSTRPIEFAVWANCPIHEGKFDPFLVPLGLKFPWPELPVNFRAILSQGLRDKMSALLRDVIKFLREIDAECFGISLSENSITVQQSSPLVVPLSERFAFVPHEIASAVSLVQDALSTSEVDYLLGRTPFVKTLDKLVRFCEELRRLRGMKRRFIRFEMSRGAVRDLFMALYKSGEAIQTPDVIRDVFIAWSRALALPDNLISDVSYDSS